MRNKAITAVAFAFALVLAAGVGLSAGAQEKKPNAKLAKQAKITMEQAREIASKRADGTIEESELEKEHGKIVYSFEFRNASGTITEVQVDAKTGEVVSVEQEKAKGKKHN